jgi:hypothetical protein
MKPEAPLHWHDTQNVTKTLQRVYKILRGNVSYGSLTAGDVGQNVDGYPVTLTTPVAPNTEFAVNHGLNRIPVGFHIMNKLASVDVYKSTTPWTKSTIYLKATVALVSVTLFIF